MLAHPVVSVVLSAGILIGLAIPAFGLHTAAFSTDALPRSLPIIKTYDRIQAAFPGEGIPAVVAVQADDVTSAPVVAQIKGLERKALATGDFKRPISLTVSPNRHVAVLDIPMVGSGTDARSENGAREPAQQPGARHHGVARRVEDVRDRPDGVVEGLQRPDEVARTVRVRVRPPLAFVLLLVTFRSIVIPVKAIVLNLLSVGAAYGVLVLVFQNHWAEGILGFKSTGGITAWLPIFLFVILFGLSMDYHVFILSRIREAFDRGMKTEDAVAHGIKTTAGTVTSAAVVMVAVFGVFATLSMLDFKQMGIGLAVAVLIDATLVRAVLLPATMKLLGDWNWYLPKSLRWLPQLRSRALAGRRARLAGQASPHEDPQRGRSLP